MRKIINKSLLLLVVMALLACPFAETVCAHESNSEPVVEDENTEEPSQADDSDTGQDAVLPLEEEVSSAEEAEADPQEPVSENVVYTEEDLAAWCEEHIYSGGTVSFGASITLTQILALYSYGSGGHITIDTGPYGLIYDGGSIFLPDFEITGEGVDVPVIDVYGVGGWRLHWIHALQDVKITATGRAGVGGIALRISQDDEYSTNLDSFFYEGQIRSYGEGAIGIYLSVALDVYCLNIEVEGENSAAVYAEQETVLYYCKLKARGVGASVVSGPGAIILDTCAASPEPQNAHVVNWHITGLIGSRLYYPVKQYDEIELYDSLLTFQLRAGDKYPTVSEQLWVSWGSDFQNIDTGVLGETVLQGYLDPPFRGLGLEDNFPLELIVDVRDPSLPCISEICFKEDSELGTYANLCFWDTYGPDDEDVVLWRSDDGGASWYEITDSSDIQWNGDNVNYYYGELTDSFMVRLEVLGEGESNIVTIYPFDRNVDWGLGGDRDGGDRIIRSKLTDDDTTGDEKSSGDETSGGDESASVSENTSGNEAAYGVRNSSNSKNTALAADTPREWEDENTIVISGKRLAALTDANPETVTFTKQGIQISVKSSLLAALGLSGSQLFTLKIELTDSSFSVLFKIDDTVILDLPFTAHIGDDVFDGVTLSSAVFVDEQGGELPSVFESDSGKLAVSCPGSGVFSLSVSSKSVPEDTTSGTGTAPNAAGGGQSGQSYGSGTPFNFTMAAFLGLCVISLSGAVFIRVKRRLVRR